jgi:hypothetical protein
MSPVHSSCLLSYDHGHRRGAPISQTLGDFTFLIRIFVRVADDSAEAPA